MKTTFVCPDCGAALPSKGAKCPYKTERKNRSIKKAQDQNLKFFTLCSFLGIGSMFLTLITLLFDAYDYSFAFHVITVIICVTGFAILLGKGETRRAIFLLCPSLFVIAGIFTLIN